MHKQPSSNNKDDNAKDKHYQVPVELEEVTPEKYPERRESAPEKSSS